MVPNRATHHIFALLPSVMSSNNYNIDKATNTDEMVNEGVHFSSEVKRWFNLWNNKSYRKKEKTDTTTNTC